MIFKLAFFFFLCVLLNTILGFIFKEGVRPLKVLVTAALSAYVVFWIL